MGYILNLRKTFKSINANDYIKTLIRISVLCQIWLKLVQWFWKRFLNFVNVFSLLRYHLHLEKGMALHLNKLESPLPKGAYVPSLVEVGPIRFWRRRFLNSFNVFSLFRSYLLLEKGVVFHLN